MDFDCLELERRLAIGFNDYLSLERRHTLVLGGQTLEEIARNDTRFRLYLRETRDVIHWLSGISVPHIAMETAIESSFE